MKSNVSIKYLWWIQDDWVSLTWSSTMMNINIFDNKKIVIDFWMFQWVWRENELNNLVDEEVLKADFLIITHAHMDHIGRIPMLLKKWFKWRIIMSKITKELAKPMLEDYVTMTEKKIADAEESNTNNKTRLREAITLLKLNDEISKNGLSKLEKEKKIIKLNKLLLNKINNDLNNSDLNKNSLKQVIEDYETSDLYKIFLAKSINECGDLLSSYWIDLNPIITKSNSIKLLKIQEKISKIENAKNNEEVWSSIDLWNDVIELNKKLKSLNIDLEKEKNKKNIKILSRKINDICNRLDLLVFVDFDEDDNLSRNFNELLLERKKIIWDLWLSEALDIAKRVSSQNIDEIISNANVLKVPELLYDTNDINNTTSIIETLDVWQELDLDNSIFLKSLNDSRSTDFRIDDIPWYIKDWLNKKIFVLPHIKKAIITRWNDEYDIIMKLSKENKEFRNKLEEALKFVKNYDLKKDDVLIVPELINIEDYYNECKSLLLENWINNRNDINSFRTESNLKYTKKELEKAAHSLIDVSEISSEKVLEAFKLRFYNAWHIEWSVQALISLVTTKVENVINWTSLNSKDDIKTWYENYLFTWDLWKFTDPNISWKPDIPKYKLDYVQCETTYGLRNHPNKMSEFQRFIKEINSTEWKVLIPAFSLQRTQEVVLELLSNKLENKKLLEEFKSIILKKKSKIKILNTLNTKSELTSEDINQKLELNSLIESYNESIENISQNVLLSWLLIDSPLSERISKIFMTELNNKYSLLNPVVQTKLLGKVFTTQLNEKDSKKLYSWKRKYVKDVIVSSWWMLQWWAIMRHLVEIISDPKAKIIFTWYQSYWTLWEEILSWAKKVKIWGEEFDVKCQVVQIQWFSSHIWNDDIMSYLTEKLDYAEWATISLTHWWKDREKVRENIQKVNDKLNVIIPKLWQSFDVNKNS